MYPLIAKWTILQGKKELALHALRELAEQVHQHEPDTHTYLVNRPDFKAKNTTTPCDGEIVFFEIYKDEKAFLAHLNGKIFTDFVKKYGELFLCDDAGNPYVIAETLDFQAGFIRPNTLQH